MTEWTSLSRACRLLKRQKLYLLTHLYDMFCVVKTLFYSPISGGALLCSKLDEERYRIGFPVTLVVLAIRSFSWFSQKFA